MQTNTPGYTWVHLGSPGLRSQLCRSPVHDNVCEPLRPPGQPRRQLLLRGSRPPPPCALRLRVAFALTLGFCVVHAASALLRAAHSCWAWSIFDILILSPVQLADPPRSLDYLVLLLPSVHSSRLLITRSVTLGGSLETALAAHS